MGNPLSACMIQDAPMRAMESPLSNCMAHDDAPKKIMLLGLDAAGKTTILYRLKFAEVFLTTPTVGYNEEIVNYKNSMWQIWDVGGAGKIRELWNRFYQNLEANAVVFIVDSQDAGRLSDAYVDLARVMNDKTFRGAPLLVFANKQDLPGAMAVEEVADRLGLFESTNQWDWWIQGLCATTGDGLFEGFDWLQGRLQEGECLHRSFLSVSPAVLNEPGWVVTSKEVAVWDQPGGFRHAGTIPCEFNLDILEVVPPHTWTNQRAAINPNPLRSALTFGRVNDPVAGWISVHSSQVRTGMFVVTLQPSQHETGSRQVLCYNIAGEEILSLDLDMLQPQSLVDLQEHIGKSIGKGKSAKFLKLVSPNGQLIQYLSQISELFIE